MKRTLELLINTALLAALPALACAGTKSIYGTDDRVEYFETSPDRKVLADSVVSLWKAADVEAAGSSFKLKTVNLGQKARMCPGERFSEQPTGAYCGGALVGEDLVLTAAHCVTNEASCKATKFVFGYKIPARGKAAAATVDADAVYGCSAVVKRYLDTEAGPALGPDYALIKLDRKVTGRLPLPVNRGSISKDTGVFVIGHPLGMPLKVAGGAKVRDASKKGYFVTDLDTFGKNSGSPVFNAATKKIEGIIVRGDEDFVYTPAGCTVMAVYDQNGGRGEEVTKISEIAAQIPALAGETADAGYQPVDTKSLQQAEIAPLQRSVSFR